MKVIKLLSVAVCAFAFVTTSPISAQAADSKKACCEATVDAGKKCDHKCCQKASEAGKVCKKCHKSEDKK
jgi:hypothetical protein